MACSLSWFSVVPVAVHLLNGGLLFGVAKALGLSRSAAVVSSLLYVTFFAHFHAAVWPPVSLHLPAVSMSLLLALRFLEKRRWLPSRTLVLVLGVAAASPFLQPLQTALQMDSTRAHYPIPLSPFPWVLPSRSFVLISPISAIVFAEVLVMLSERIRALCRVSRRTRALVLAGVLLALCLPNLLAIRVGLFRGRMVNSFSFYDGLRGARPNAFAPLFQQGISQMSMGRDPEALDRFQQAARARPFLLQYLLGPCRLSDLRWITGPSGLRCWVRQVGEERARVAGALAPQDRGTLQGIRREISEYALCLFFISALERRAGRLEESRTWLSQMRYLERNPERIASWIGGLPPVQGDPMLARFVSHFGDPTYFRDPLPWRMDDYGFGRFLVRLLAGWDIPSTWDRQMAVGI